VLQRLIFASVFACAATIAGTHSSAAPACDVQTSALGVARTVEIDTSVGPIFGSLTRQLREPSFLRPKEVVLTFDDGPMPWITKSILDTLDQHCTKATFFSVGRMALAYPGTVRDLMRRGHTLGTHTYTHPFNMPRMKSDSATGEIERGIAAVSLAAGEPIAPFFRFTGLSDNARLMGYLQSRGIAAFTVDVVSNDSYIGDTDKLVARTLSEIEANKGGIVLFHDIKSTTAKALPTILARLKSQGYSVVHIVPKTTVAPLQSAVHDVAPKLAKLPNSPASSPPLLPFFGAVGPELKTTEAVAPSPLASNRQPISAPALAPTTAAVQRHGEVTSIVPIARDRSSPKIATASIGSTAPSRKSATTELKSTVTDASSSNEGWVTKIKRQAKLKPAKSER
jgi:peptidoglycan-N-acetylglucosamine deacetylase